MARQEIILGTAPTGLGGDPPRTASTKINAMTTELYGVTNNLKTASTRDSQVNRTDNTDGRLLLVGAFGFNGGSSINMSASSDANDLSVSGNYLFANGGLNLPTGVPFPHITVITAGPGYSFQSAKSSNTASSAIRMQYNGVFTPWYTNYTTLNAVSSVASGGLIESGSSASGTYTKWGDGTMQASLVISKPAINTSVAFGSLFYSNDQVAATNYAAAFISPPEVSVFVTSIGYGGVSAGCVNRGTASASPRLVLISPRVFTSDCIIEITARGRWKN